MATFERLIEEKESEKEAAEKVGIWVPPNTRPLLTLIKAVSPGMVGGMVVKSKDSRRYCLLVCDLWAHYSTAFPDLCDGNKVVCNFGGQD